MKKIINKKWWMSLLRLIQKDITTKKKRGVVLLLVVALIWFYLGMNAGLLWALFLSFALYQWENRIIGVLALATLVSCPFLLSFKQDALAEQMAVYAYYFLVMTVVLQIMELRREGGDEGSGVIQQTRKPGRSKPWLGPREG
ncbi:MAG: hypothetical protein WAZ40_03565 [Minisyncoccia bacterium]